MMSDKQLLSLNACFCWKELEFLRLIDFDMKGHMNAT
jgi:hypothetical protein